MNQKKRGFIDVDKLVGQVQPEDVLQFYEVTDVELHRSGTEVRMRCVLNCGKKCETGEPRKHHFVKGFHRGQELFGQEQQRLDQPGYRETIADLGVLVVEGPNDVIRLDALGVPAVALCSNRITEAQARKLARWAKQLSGSLVTVMLDNDHEGEQGSRQTVYELAKHCRVRLAWSPGSFDGTLAGKQPESLTPNEWELVRGSL